MFDGIVGWGALWSARAWGAGGSDASDPARVASPPKRIEGSLLSALSCSLARTAGRSARPRGGCGGALADDDVAKLYVITPLGVAVDDALTYDSVCEGGADNFNQIQHECRVDSSDAARGYPILTFEVRSSHDAARNRSIFPRRNHSENTAMHAR